MAFVMQLHRDRGESSSRHGTTAFTVLLMQNLAIVPIMALVPLLAGGGSPPTCRSQSGWPRSPA